MDQARLDLELTQIVDELAGVMQGMVAAEVRRQLSLDRCRPTWCYKDAATVASIPTPVYTVDVDRLNVVGIRIYTESTTAGTWDIHRSTDNGASWATIFSTKPTVAGGSHVGGANAVLLTHTGGVELRRGHLLKLIVSGDGGATGVTVQLNCEAQDGLRR